ncbi:spectinomycin phosphotransferase [Lentzea atacamensis]|uniref:Spectinomycin phosphotransferase n=1 Tax=Lentzea atacamensis TaxID=531938 RepID=A0A316HS76_9PSEU|nr:aminoglycoside phosphotransferase family protein [Lentzea atacamensis]PWK81172.1 spectinomycin phosphotransferase [Lentzea atacamensis]
MDLPAGLSDRDLTEGLARFGISGPVQYAPLGFGDYHWTVAGRWFTSVADLTNKAHCGPDALAGLRSAMDTASALQLPFVVAPLRTDDGETVVPLDDRYALSVFPLLTGKSGSFDDRFSDEERDEVLTLLAELHSHEPPAGTPVAPVDSDGRDALEELLDEPGEWAGGPYSADAREVFVANTQRIRDLLAEFDRLAAQVPPRRVVTHGEPHPGNLIRTPDGYRLVDWDTVGLAPPERDLALLDGDLSKYTELTGHEPVAAGLALYRLRWRLNDIGEFAVWLKGPHERTPDTEVAWRGFRETLATP